MDFSSFLVGAAAPQTVSANITVTARDQTITSTQDGDGNHPGEAVICAGPPTHWMMTSTAPFS